MIQITTDLAECKKLWEHWNKNKSSLFDEWDVRESLFVPRLVVPHFISNDQFLLPLWYHVKDELYEFFGGDLPEENRIFLRASSLAEVLAALPAWTYLFYLCKDEHIPFEEQAAHFCEMTEHPKFILRCPGFKTFEDYLATFSGKHRKNLMRDLAGVEKHVRVVYNDVSHVDTIAAFNKKRFKEDSSFHDELHERGFLNLIELARKRGWLHLYALEKNSIIVGAEAAIMHGDVYTVLNGGADPAVPNAGKLLIMLHIKNALACGARIIDFMSHDSGWKTLWNLEPVPQWEYVKEGEEEETA